MKKRDIIEMLLLNAYRGIDEDETIEFIDKVYQFSEENFEFIEFVEYCVENKLADIVFQLFYYIQYLKGQTNAFSDNPKSDILLLYKELMRRADREEDYEVKLLYFNLIDYLEKNCIDEIVEKKIVEKKICLER
jgi:hypothetical protein